MSRSDSLKICHHIHVRELLLEAGAAHFGFEVKRTSIEGHGIDEDVELLIPYPVLEALAVLLPQILADMRARGVANVAATRNGEVSNPGQIAGEILGLSFGTWFPQIDAVMTGITVHAYEQDQVIQRMGPPVLINLSLLKELHAHLPKMIAHLRQQGADGETFALPTLAMSFWDQGPQVEMNQARYLCQGLHVRGFDLERGAAVLTLMVSEADGSDRQIKTADYFLPFRVLTELGDSIEKLLFKAQDAGSAGRSH